MPVSRTVIEEGIPIRILAFLPAATRITVSPSVVAFTSPARSNVTPASICVMPCGTVCALFVKSGQSVINGGTPGAIASLGALFCAQLAPLKPHTTDPNHKLLTILAIFPVQVVSLI